jgi:hypothetical protein
MLLILAITIVLAGKKTKDHSKKDYYFKPQHRTKDGSCVRSMCALNTINNIMQNVAQLLCDYIPFQLNE